MASGHDIKTQYPDFLTIAEVYWDMEWQMQQQGFGYTYDKRLDGRLLHGGGVSVREHLSAGIDYQQHLVRFIENHDEPRAAKAYGEERSKVAAVLFLTLPGLRLVHDGQMEGRQVKLPVHLGCRPTEELLDGMNDFYSKLLKYLSDPVFHFGEWRLLEAEPVWEGNSSFQIIVAHQWKLDNQARIIVTNLSDQPAHSHIKVAIPELVDKGWSLRDLLHDAQYQWSGDEMLDQGLYLELGGYGFHLFKVVTT